jgi:hypothetical protein
VAKEAEEIAKVTKESESKGSKLYGKSPEELEAEAMRRLREREERAARRTKELGGATGSADPTKSRGGTATAVPDVGLIPRDDLSRAVIDPREADPANALGGTAIAVPDVGTATSTIERGEKLVEDRVNEFFSDLELEKAEDWTSRDAGAVRAKAESKLVELMDRYKTIDDMPDDVKLEYGVYRQLLDAAEEMANIRR